MARAIDEAAVLALQAAAALVAAVLAGLGQLSSDSGQRDVAVVAACILLVGWLAGVTYEVAGARGATLGKRLVGLRVVDVSSGARPSLRQALRRWVALAAVQPVVWLLVGVGGAEPRWATLLVVLAVGASLTWRVVLLASISGTTSIHDRFARTAVVTARPRQALVRGSG